MLLCKVSSVDFPIRAVYVCLLYTSVVIDDPDFSRNSGALEKRAEMHRKKVGFVVLGPRAGRHGTVLIGIDFVLNRYRLNGNSGGFILAQIAKKIIGVARHIGVAHAAAKHRAIGLHPAGGTPRPVSYTHLDVYKRQVYNTLRPHSALGYRPPAPAAFAPQLAALRSPTAPYEPPVAPLSDEVVM